ncbi:hypothetical protein GW17_00037048, partial [Ensete ventricosum]
PAHSLRQPPCSRQEQRPPEGQPPVTRSIDDLPRFPPDSDQALLGDATRRPMPTPSASVRSLLDPGTLFSDSTDSLRAQLRLVNQRIDDVHKTIRMKDERGKSPLCGSPFMALYGMSDAIICRAFSMTLRGIAQGWYDQLPPSSIHSFDQLAREFEANFFASAWPKPTVASLLRMRQKEDEHLGRYLACFTEEIRVIPDAHPLLVIQAFMIGIRTSCLFWSLMERPHTTMSEMLQRANQYVATEILVAEKREDQKCPRAEPSWGSPPGLLRKRTKRAEQTVS